LKHFGADRVPMVSPVLCLGATVAGALTQGAIEARNLRV